MGHPTNVTIADVLNFLPPSTKLVVQRFVASPFGGGLTNMLNGLIQGGWNAGYRAGYRDRVDNKPPDPRSGLKVRPEPTDPEDDYVDVETL